jgi:hypothetical protein
LLTELETDTSEYSDTGFVEQTHSVASMTSEAESRWPLSCRPAYQIRRSNGDVLLKQNHGASIYVHKKKEERFVF